MASQSSFAHSISFGALKRILIGEELENIVLQILGYKQVPGSNNNRFRLLLNDGVVLFPYAILATQLNNLIYENHLEKYTIFKLKEFEYSQLLANKKVIICIDIEILIPGSEVRAKISENDSSIITSTCSELFSPVPSTSTVINFDVNFKYQLSTSYGQNWGTAPSSACVNSLSKTTESESTRFSSICDLSPYRNKWSIKARLSYKSPIYHYFKRNRQGRYFAFHLLDESDEIRVVAFNEHVEKYYKMLETFKIYVISNANIKLSPVNSQLKCIFEMVVDNRTEIEFFADDDSSIPKPEFNFKTIASLSLLPKDSCIDVIGVCYKSFDVNDTVTQCKEISKRTIFLIDKSKKSIRVTLWGAQAENFSISINSVIAIKNAKLSSFNGCSLSVTSESIVYIDPNFYKTAELKTWFQTAGSLLLHSMPSINEQTTASQNWKTLAETSSYFNTDRNSTLYHTTKATIVMVKKDCMYQACNSFGCLKKVHSLNGLYKCDKCNTESNNFRWAYLLVFQIADFTGSHWVTAFHEVAENLIGINPDELNLIKRNSEEKYFDILNNLNLRSYIFKLQSNFKTYGDNTRLKTVLLSFISIEPVLYTKKLLNDIKIMKRLLNIQ